LGLYGCASVPEDANFECVANEVKERTGLETDWHVGCPPHPAIQERITALSRQPLTSTTAVQVALLNNPGLQAKYAELGVAQADLVQAGLLTNPTFEGIFTFPAGGGKVDLEFDLIFNFLNILTIPLRTAIAESELEETQLKMTKSTIDLASEARKSYYNTAAAHNLRDVTAQLVDVSKAIYMTTKALRTAGNVSALHLAGEESDYEQAKLELVSMESAAEQYKQRLRRLLGLQKDLTFEKKLHDPLKDNFHLTTLMEKALHNSLDLALIKQKIETLCRRYSIANFTALIPELDVGARGERLEGQWSTGPILAFAIPIFDQGQPALARVNFEIRGLQEAYADRALEIKASSQILEKRFLTIKQKLKKLQDVILPLQQKILNEMQLFYNAMQLSVFALLNSKQKQIKLEKAYAEAVLEYWLVRSDIEQLLHGSLPHSVENH
jgi:cobalt-zinc-cadmium efflux system outer membrane protein